MTFSVGDYVASNKDPNGFGHITEARIDGDGIARYAVGWSDGSRTHSETDDQLRLMPGPVLVADVELARTLAVFEDDGRNVAAADAVDRVAAYWRATGFQPDMDAGRAGAERVRNDDPRLFDFFLNLASEHDTQAPAVEPRFPKGTPEYDAYAAELRTELEKFANGEVTADQQANGKPTVTVTVDADEMPELLDALHHASEYARRTGTAHELRSQNPDTRRYAWARVANALGLAIRTVQETPR